MATGELEETLLPKTLALPIFASDPLSSVAYATESALVVLVAASATAAHLVFPISIAIAALLAIVVVSYRQTVRAYETSGGAYIVAQGQSRHAAEPRRRRGAAHRLRAHGRRLDRRGHLRGHLVRAVARRHTRCALSLGCLALIVFVNLRGVRESGLRLRAADLRVRRGDVRCSSASGSSRRSSASTPQAVVARSARGRRRGRDALRPAARVLVRLDRADRRRGDRERRQRVPAAARQERRDDARGARRRSRSRSSSASRTSRCRSTRGRARPPRSVSQIARATFPAGSTGALHVLRRPGADARVLSSPRTRRSRASPGSRRCSPATASRPVSS